MSYYKITKYVQRLILEKFKFLATASFISTVLFWRFCIALLNYEKVLPKRFLLQDN